jgi:hypothetical protein
MEWKKIEGWNYEVSETGQIRRSNNGRIKKQLDLGNSGYFIVYLSRSGKDRIFSVHRLVALYFVPNPEGKAEVNHLDGNKKNNRSDNLAWVTRSENIQHAYDSGLKKYRPLHYKGKFGEQHNRSKKVRCIETGDVFGSMAEAERTLGIGSSGVSWSIANLRPINGMHFEAVK